MDKNKYKELGISNAWKEYPKEITECQKKGHKVISKQIGRCYTEYRCRRCKILWTTDSSD